MSIIVNEHHKETLFHLYPKPDGFAPGQNLGTRVHFNEDPHQTDSVLYTVNVETTQVLNNTNAMCVFNTISKFELNVKLGQMIPIEVWQPLRKKANEECNKLYKEKVKGTYLDGTDIPIVI